MVTYILEVHTGEEEGGDTDARCYIQLYGTRGDTGARALAHSNQPRPCRRGQTDIYRVDAVSLDQVNKVLLGHDGKEKGELSFSKYLSF